jgi:hypothetical protein
MIRLNVVGSPGQTSMAASPAEASAVPRRRLELPAPAGKMTPGTSPLPGFVCEACFDAPAVALVPAPWGEEMGVCATCYQTRVHATLPVRRVPAGQQTFWHTILDQARLAAYRAIAEGPLPTWWDRCVSTAPVPVCTCGSYRLTWGEEAST